MNTSRTRVRLSLLVFVVPVFILLAAGCGSMPKAELETRLLGLEKNAPIRQLERSSLEVDLGRGPEVLQLTYYRAGEPVSAGPLEEQVPVVLLHGTPSTLFTWVEIIHGGNGFEGLSAAREVYALEVIGHGVADGEGPLGFETCARYVAGALRELGLERVHLVGQSYGGEFALRTALNEPELVASLVLINSSGIERRDQDWLDEEVAMRENPLADIGWRLNSRERIETALVPHYEVIPPERIEEFFLVCENATNWKAMIDLAQDENGTRQHELATLGMPTLVLWGEDDVAYPVEPYAERFASDIPDARLLVLPDTGHYPHEERPEETVRALETFFSSVEHTAGRTARVDG